MSGDSCSTPAGCVALVVIGLFLPPSKSSQDGSFRSILRNKFAFSNVQRVDILGVTLLLGASILLVFAFESAGTKYAWDSPTVITTLVIAVVMGAAFGSGEYRTGRP